VIFSQPENVKVAGSFLGEVSSFKV